MHFKYAFLCVCVRVVYFISNAPPPLPLILLLLLQFLLFLIEPIEDRIAAKWASA